MPQLAYQISGTGLGAVAPSLVQAEQAYAQTVSQRAAEGLQRRSIDYQNGVTSFAAYEKALMDDLSGSNPDNPRYNSVYASLLQVREARNKLQDADILDRFEKGVLDFKEVESYFKKRISEVAAETPQFYGLTGAQRGAFVTNLQRNMAKLEASWNAGEIQLNDYVEGLQSIRQMGGFVENSPVAIAIGKDIFSAKISSELAALAEQFQFAQGADLKEYVDRLNEVKNRFSPGSPIATQIQGVSNNILSNAYTQFSNQQATEVTNLFNSATKATDYFSKYGTDAQYQDALTSLFGISNQAAQSKPISLKEFATSPTDVLSRSLQPYQEAASKIPTIDSAQIKKDLDRSSLASQEAQTSSTLNAIKNYKF